MPQPSRLFGVLSVLLMMLAGSVEAAQYRHYCPPTYSYYSTGSYNYYSAPTYAQSYTPYVEPARQEYVQKVVAQEITVAPLIVTVPIVSQAYPVQSYGPSHYYSVQENYLAKAELRSIIREELRAYLGNQGGGGMPPANPPTPPPPSPPPNNPPNNPPLYQKVTDLGEDTTTPAELQAPVIAAFRDGDNSCFKCHGAGQIRGNLKLLYDKGGNNFVLAKQTRERRSLIYVMASSGVMPPAEPGKQQALLPQKHLQGLLKWVIEAGN